MSNGIFRCSTECLRWLNIWSPLAFKVYTHSLAFLTLLKNTTEFFVTLSFISPLVWNLCLSYKANFWNSQNTHGDILVLFGDWSKADTLALSKERRNTRTRHDKFTDASSHSKYMYASHQRVCWCPTTNGVVEVSVMISACTERFPFTDSKVSCKPWA